MFGHIVTIFQEVEWIENANLFCASGADNSKWSVGFGVFRDRCCANPHTSQGPLRSPPVHSRGTGPLNAVDGGRSLHDVPKVMPGQLAYIFPALFLCYYFTRGYLVRTHPACSTRRPLAECTAIGAHAHRSTLAILRCYDIGTSFRDLDLKNPIFTRNVVSKKI